MKSRLLFIYFSCININSIVGVCCVVGVGTTGNSPDRKSVV